MALTLRTSASAHYLPHVHGELLEDWMERLRTKPLDQSIPILGTDALSGLQILCDSLHQDAYVFVMAVEVFDSYVKNLDSSSQQQPSHRLTPEETVDVSLAVISVCSKNVGGPNELKARQLIPLYETMHRPEMSTHTICQNELRVLRALECQLPNTTRLDDVIVLLAVYGEQRRFPLPAEMYALCEQILVTCLLHQRELYARLESHYVNAKCSARTTARRRDMALKQFEDMMRRRCFVPAGIVLSAMRMTQFTTLIDERTFRDSLARICDVRLDHLMLCQQTIIDLVQQLQIAR